MNREVEEGFIRNTARKVYQELSQKQKDYIFWHPSTTDHMFGFGMVIRNKYIYDAHVRCEADHVSSMIVARLASMIIPNYDISIRYYYYVYENWNFSLLRRLYYLITGELPDDIIDEYVTTDESEEFQASLRAVDAVKKAVLNEKRFEQLCNKYQIGIQQKETYKQYVDETNNKYQFVIPYDLIVLGSDIPEMKVRKKYLNMLQAVMKYYRDIETYVKIALKADGSNIQYASERLRDNTELAEITILHQNRLFDKVMSYLSSRLRDDIQIVLLDVREGKASVKYYSDRLRDSEEVARALIKAGRQSKLSEMSERIQKKYRRKQK